MLIVFMFSIFAAAFYEFVCLGKAFTFAAPLHQACLALSTTEQLSFYTRAALCGNEAALHHLYAENSGNNWAHFLLFSSFHITLLETSCRRIHRYGRILGFAFILSFTGFLGVPLRLLRLLLQLAFEFLNSRWQLRWSYVQLVTLTGLVIALTCVRSRPELLSLSLGWVGAIAGRLAQTKPRSRLKSALTFQLLFWPALLPLTFPHPLTAVLTLFLAPVFLIFWPLGLLEFAFAQKLPLDAALRQTSGALLETLPQALPPQHLPEFVVFGYIALLTFVARRRELSK